MNYFLDSTDEKPAKSSTGNSSGSVIKLYEYIYICSYHHYETAQKT